MSIPDIHRRGVKNTDLVKEELPTESALAVNWNVEKDILFQGEPEGETKKLERYAIYIEFPLRSSRFSFTIHPQGKISTARTVARRITVG